MMGDPGTVPSWFCGFASAYRKSHSFEVLFISPEGEVLAGPFQRTDCSCRSSSDQRRVEAVQQTLYWGSTVINLCCDDGYAMWGVPVMLNNRITGGLIVQGVDLEAAGPGNSPFVQEAADCLLTWALRDNLIPEAVIQLAHFKSTEASQRFRAIEQVKQFASDDLRGLYLREEPGLLTAIKFGEKREARSILNRILVKIYGYGSQRMDLLKSFLLELIVMMNRAAVEAGANPAVLLGSNYLSLTELAGIRDEEELAQWIRRMLDLLIDAIRENDDYPCSLLLTRAMGYMRENLARNLKREDVARFVGISSSRFGQVMSETLGRSFTEELTRMRVDKARQLLRKTDLGLSAIAIDCGFYDQSHLSRSFRKVAGTTPGEFRRKYS